MEARAARTGLVRFPVGLLAIVVCLCVCARTNAANANEARVTRVVRDVKVLAPQGSSRAALLNERIAAGATVQTGADSQTELTFDDRTLARLAAKTTFAFGPDPRKMDLPNGAMLVRAPAHTRSAQIRTDNATVVVTGTTSFLEHNAGKYLKLVVLQGTARVFLPEHIGESVLVKEGQLLLFRLGPKLTSLPAPVDVDIERMLTTSSLIKGWPALGNEAVINQRIAEQKKRKAKGGLVDTNLVINGRGTVVSLVEQDDAGATATAATRPSPAPKSGQH
jgi:hypothetical protein